MKCIVSALVLVLTATAAGVVERIEIGRLRDQQPQQTGMLFIIRQQVQPAFIMVAMQSQQAWIMAAHWASPLVQVTETPLSVISHLHMPIVRLQQQTIIPFIIRQQLHIPP